MSASLVLAVSIISSVLLGLFVFWSNPRRATHRVFGLLCLNPNLWAGGAPWIVHRHTQEEAQAAIILTFIVATFLPANFYQFIAHFPQQRFAASRLVSTGLYLGALLLSGLTFSPWYINSLDVFPDLPPLVIYGPVFPGFSVLVIISMASTFANLRSKLLVATGIERRQIEHVIAGIFLYWPRLHHQCAGAPRRRAYHRA